MPPYIMMSASGTGGMLLWRISLMPMLRCRNFIILPLITWKLLSFFFFCLLFYEPCGIPANYGHLSLYYSILHVKFGVLNRAYEFSLHLVCFVFVCKLRIIQVINIWYIIHLNTFHAFWRRTEFSVQTPIHSSWKYQMYATIEDIRYSSS